MRYLFHGLTLETPFVCPELLPSTEEADVVVGWGVPDTSDNVWRNEGVCYKAAHGIYLLSVEGVADYLVESGDCVTIAKVTGADEDDLRLFFYNEVMGALLMQRGCMLLKGCVIERGGKGIAFIGRLPLGKTMAAAELAKRGFRIVSDGICCLTGDVEPMAQPGYPRLKLCSRSLKTLGLSAETLKPVRSGMRRYYLPVEQSFCDKPVALERIYLFAFHNRPGLLVEEATGGEKLPLLMSACYHREMVMALGTLLTTNRMATRVTNATTVKIIRYNESHLPFGDAIEGLERELAG